MTTENTETTTTNEPADEPGAGASPAAEDSPADSSVADIEAELAPEGEEQAPETPEQKVDREKAERAKKRVADAESAEKRAEDARLRRQREREEAEQRERVSLREQQANALIREAQNALQDINAKRQSIAKGGYEALKALGIDYGDWTKKTLEETSPDAAAQRALREAQELKKELERRDAETARQREESQIEEGKRRFESFVDSNADDFPDAAVLPSKTLRMLADESAREFYSKNGFAPSFALLAPILDRKAKELHEEQKTKSAKRTQTATTPSDGATTPQAKPGHTATAPSNRTLTPALAGTRAKPPRQMTEEEVDEWARQELRAALRADKAAE